MDTQQSDTICEKISEYAYSVFMAQFFIWPLTKKLVQTAPAFL